MTNWDETTLKDQTGSYVIGETRKMAYVQTLSADYMPGGPEFALDAF